MDQEGKLLPPGHEGEIVIRGEHVMAGYANDPSMHETAFAGGWFCTGDRGHIDEDGYVFLTGRIKEIINRGGEKVAPREVEEALLAHSTVAQAVVFGIPHPRLGEEVAAAVVLRENGAATERDIRAFALSRLADFKVPSRVVFVDQIPTGPSGKIQRVGLHEALAPLLTTSFVAPCTPTEVTLAGLWAEMLGLDRVGIHNRFLELGGDSLRATQVVTRARETFGVEVSLRSLLEAATIAEMAEVIVQQQAAQAEPVETIPHRSSTGPCPLSFAQQRLWFLAQLEPDSPHYHEANAVRLRGPLQVAALQQALTALVARHEALRTTFITEQGRPVQMIAASLSVPLPVVDLRASAAADREAELQQRLVETSRDPFDLTRDLMLRAVLLRLRDTDHVLLLVIHHIAFDGWSMSIVMRELSALYNAYLTGASPPLPPLSIQYADYALWQRRWLQGATLQTQLAYWMQQLDGAPTVLDLCTDRPRPPVQTYRGARQGFALPAPLLDALKALSQQEGATLFMLLLAAFQTLLHRYTGQTDILVGSPIAGRTRKETEGLIGFFVNTCVLRTNLADNPSFRELLHRVREVALGAYAHQDLPFERLIEELHLERSLDRTPLFQVMFVFQNVPKSDLELSGLRVSSVEVESGIAKFDLTLVMTEAETGLRGHVEYNTDLFDAATIARMVGHFQTLLEGIAAHPDHTLSGLPLLTAAERQQLVVTWNEMPAAVPVMPCLPQWFEAQVERSPTAVAVICGDERLTYGELNAQANHLAHYLRSLGVGPETLVGLCVERSLAMLVGMLGILKAGGAYVPLEPTNPKERLAFMLADTQASVLLTQEQLVADLPAYSGQIVCLDADRAALAQQSGANPPRELTADHLAYVIYTSGSTGRPKGVLVTHRDVVRLFTATQGWFHFDAHDVWTLFHSYAFDFSVWECWGALLYGGRLVVVPFEVSRSPAVFLRLLRREGVTVLNQTPSAFRQLYRPRPRDTYRRELALRLIIFGGEALDLQKSAALV